MQAIAFMVVTDDHIQVRDALKPHRGIVCRIILDNTVNGFKRTTDSIFI
jgi:hypothetical protein